MGVMSKIVVAAVMAQGVDAVIKKGKERKGMFGGAVRPLGAFMGAFSAASSSATPSDLAITRENHARALSELSSLLNDNELMIEAYNDFRLKRYGKGCSGDECNAYYTRPADDDFRYVTFQQNVAKAHERNIQSDGHIHHGITSLMDRTEEEFQQLLGYKAPEGHNQGVVPSEVLKLKSTTDRTRRDWRDEGAVTPVKDQGQCGSCWAFSTVETIESAAIVQGLADSSDPFIGAPQELVSCDNAGEDQGCNGGLPSNALKYFKTTPVEPESDYPYTSGTTKRDGTCRLDRSEGVYEVTSQTALSIWGIGEDTDMKNWIMDTGAMSVAVHANNNWQTYTGGVMTYEDCDDTQPVNHAVQAVALDTDEGYWTIRNSWADLWGEQGFIRLEYNKNTCNVAADSVGATVHKVGGAASSSKSTAVIV